MRGVCLCYVHDEFHRSTPPFGSGFVKIEKLYLTENQQIKNENFKRKLYFFMNVTKFKHGSITVFLRRLTKCTHLASIY